MSELVFIEECDASSTGGATIDEYLELSRPVMEERGTNSASVGRDENGVLLTPAGYSDNCIDVFAPGATVVASRRLSGETWVNEPGADYLTRNWFGAQGQDPRFQSLEYGSTHWLYTGRYQETTPLTAAPNTALWDASISRCSPDGRQIVFVEFRAQPDVWIWTQDVQTGERRAVCRLPQDVLRGDISISGDGRWVLIGLDNVSLIDLQTADVTRVPNHITSACWLTTEGPSSILAARNIGGTSAEIGRYDLATGKWERLCDVDSRLAELDVSADGQIAAVANAPGQDYWMPGVVTIDPSSGKLTEVLPWRFEAGPWRRGSRPRWISGQPANDEAVRPSPDMLARAQRLPVQPTSEDMGRSFDEWFERLQRRIQVLESSEKTIVVNELVALADFCSQVNPSVKEANEELLVPFLNRLAQTTSSPSAKREVEWAVRQFLAM
jgi:hypothetical protein